MDRLLCAGYWLLRHEITSLVYWLGNRAWVHLRWSLSWLRIMHFLRIPLGRRKFLGWVLLLGLVVLVNDDFSFLVWVVVLLALFLELV